MAEPFSIAASAISVLGTAAKVGRELHIFFNNFKDSEADLKAVCTDFDETVSILKALREQSVKRYAESGPATINQDRDDEQRDFETVITSCEDTFSRLHLLALRYNRIREAKPSRNVFWQKAKWSYVGKDEASELAKQLAAQKITLSLRLQMVGNTDAKQSRENTEEILDQLNQRFAEVKALVSKLESKNEGVEGAEAQWALKRWMESASTYAGSILGGDGSNTERDLEDFSDQDERTPYLERLQDSYSMQQPVLNDALDYLDEMKDHYREQPWIYNDFLDIMKDFKAQILDTPGVIERVVELLDGHSHLIEGFNKFLPPGYAIEVGENIENYATCSVRVRTPLGSYLEYTAPGTIAPSSDATVENYEHSIEQREEYNSITASLYSSHPNPILRGPIDFNTALGFVNKIKRRFPHRPERYREFLELIQSYQRGLIPLPDVYTHIAILLAPAPDLLEEFKLFLPENQVEVQSTEESVAAILAGLSLSRPGSIAETI